MEEKRGPRRPPKEIEEKPESIGRVHPRDFQMFYGSHDKGAAKPAFCYPQRVQLLKEEVNKMEKNLAMGFIGAERKMAYEARLTERKKRLDSIDESVTKTQKIVNQDKDYWVSRRKELGEQIRAAMPSRKDIEKRRVNPYRVAKMEKTGLGKLKTEFIVVSRALGEESNTSFLQRD